MLEQIGVEPPTTYEELLEAAETIRAAGIMENPVGGAYAAGWNLAEEFVNMYIGHGGEFYKPGTAEVVDQQRAGHRDAEHDEGADRVHEPRLPDPRHQRHQRRMGSRQRRADEHVGHRARAF